MRSRSDRHSSERVFVTTMLRTSGCVGLCQHLLSGLLVVLGLSVACAISYFMTIAFNLMSESDTSRLWYSGAYIVVVVIVLFTGILARAKLTVYREETTDMTNKGNQLEQDFSNVVTGSALSIGATGSGMGTDNNNTTPPYVSRTSEGTINQRSVSSSPPSSHSFVAVTPNGVTRTIPYPNVAGPQVGSIPPSGGFGTYKTIMTERQMFGNHPDFLSQ